MAGGGSGETRSSGLVGKIFMEARTKIDRFFAGLLAACMAILPAAFLYNDPTWSQGPGWTGFLKHLVIREMAVGLFLVFVAAAWHYWFGHHPFVDKLLRRGLPWVMLAMLSGLACIWFGQYFLFGSPPTN